MLTPRAAINREYWSQHADDIQEIHEAYVHLKCLSQFVENGNVNNDNIPIDIELISVRSTKTMLDDLTDNINSIFASETLRRFIYKYDDNDINKQSCVDAHNCIAHLLDNTP
ncbi:unnamed protein product [Rotaria sp. Silwood1]|nr:unnamed protein product [Rotaria sp. Silwood1]